MREILFRGKRVDNGEWVFGYYTELPEGDIGGTLMAGASEVLCEDTAAYIISIETKQCPSFSPAYPIQVFDADWCKVRSETVGQYTGLTDKNGKKIFEGDIVELTYYTLPEERKVMAEVAYEEESAAFVLYSFGTKNKGICVEICNTNKVIGNIYDNPELLKGEE